jgi:acetolactate synthase I/II/III large subunit
MGRISRGLAKMDVSGVSPNCRVSHSTIKGSMRDMAKITLNNVTVFDAYMALHADRGIDYWFANAGTDFAPVVKTLAKAQILETRVPTRITCPHENTAMQMAIGLFPSLSESRRRSWSMSTLGTANGMTGLLNTARGQSQVKD